MHNGIRKIIGAAAIGALALTGCSAGAKGGQTEKVDAVASFYPLAYVTSQVGGDLVQVTNLTPSGEAHEVELSAKDLTTMSQADALIYLSGFQASVDDAVKEAAPKNTLDVAKAAKLKKLSAEQAAEHEEEHEHEADHEGEHEEKAGHDHHHGAFDPHFWLDPQRLSQVVPQVVATLTKADPKHGDTFKKNGKALQDKLSTLDKQYREGLTKCATPTAVTAHEAYGYMADRYGFEQVGVKGVDPEAETSLTRLQEVANIAKAKKVNVLFSESALGDKDTKTLAEQLGIKSEVLDPLEIQVDKNRDYLQVMRDNLGKLSKAMKCQ
ncbi:metal ABC transporter substrate-binding protein [Varibaculum vaginae]|uniref:metal ABC transporter substrate-binding protein n=1 Tax=Varibaculum vaginae TaxID=2364797 RepID=UPI000F08FB16|nr:metal ABC transporter substrate-binding protein [Varibaculum vaginae]